MARAARALVLFVVFLLSGFVPAAHASDVSGLAVRLVADQPIVTIDRDAPSDQALTYEVVVTNGEGDVAPGVVVDAELPGGAVRRELGDIAAGGEARVLIASSVPATNTGGPIESVAVARTADGREVTSPPARVDVQVISSAVYDRDTPDTSVVPTTGAVTTVAPTQVLGAVYERPLRTTLARTGVPTVVVAGVGIALVALGALLVRRAATAG